MVNRLLRLPGFATKIATKDWHPADHISFAANHPSATPFVDVYKVVNPFNADESYETRLWPVHCVAGTAGAQLVPGLEVSRADRVLEKGLDARVEMYSAFYDPFAAPRVSDSGLAGALREARVTDVYVVGLAADYCVLHTALDARKEGFTVYVVEEGTRAVDPGDWPRHRRELEEAGVRVVSVDGAEVARVGDGKAS